MGRTKSVADLVSKFFCSIPDCGETFTRLAGLRKHTKLIHEKTNEDDDEEDEEKKLEEELKYQCDEIGCGKRFRKRKDLCTHKCQQHNQEWKKKYACDRCEAKFVTASRLKNHLRKHDGYPCPDCEHRAETWSALRRHKGQVHPTKHKCDQCGKEFPKPSELKRHKRVHEKEIKCPNEDCQMKMCPWMVAKHVKTYHSKSLPDCRQLTDMDTIISSALNEDNQNFVCSQCKKTFNKSRNLRLHQQNVHHHDDDDEKKPTAQQKRTPTYVCTIENCHRRFATVTKLENHLNCHSKTKPMKCPEFGCKAAFAGRSALQRHVKLRHMKVLKTYELIGRLADVGGDREWIEGDDTLDESEDMMSD